MTCLNCGAQFETVGKFCPKCGSKLEQPAIEQEIDNQATELSEDSTAAIPGDSETVVADEAVAAQVATAEKPSAEENDWSVQDDYSTYNDDSYQLAQTPSGRKRLSVGGKILSIVLAICLFVTSVAALLIYDVRNTLKKDSIETIVEEINIIELALEADLVEPEDLDLFYDDMYIYFGMDMSDTKLEKFIDKSTIKTFFAQEVSQFVEDALSGDDAEIAVTYSDIYKLLQKNESLIEKQFGKTLSYSEMDEITYWFMGDSREEVLVDSDSLEEQEPAVYSVAVMALSYITMAVFIVLTAVIIFFMMRMSLSAGTLGVGIVFTIVGALMAIVAPVLGKLILDNTLVGVILGEFAMMNITISAVVLAVGVVMIVTRAIVLKVRRL